MNIALITKTREKIVLDLYDENLKNLIQESFKDIYTLNFFLQTIPKKFNQDKTLLILNNLEKTKSNRNLSDIESVPGVDCYNVKLLVANDENSYFIQEEKF